jgi:hypothetical protein
MAVEKEYRVELSAIADVKGVLYIPAGSPEEAKAKALAQTGEVSWSYQGTDDSSIEARAYEHN